MWVDCVVSRVVVVWGVTQLRDVVYVVCDGFSAILRFNATTHERLTDIVVKGLRNPCDIVACEQTSQLYVADWWESVWRVSADGADIKLWWIKSSVFTSFTPWSISARSTRLLVTSRHTNQLMQLDSLGDELRRVQLPDNMEPLHAVESLTTTFIVSHKNTPLEQHQISEFNADGQVMRQFTGSRLSPLGCPQHLSVDSHGNIFVADQHNRRILLLDAQLKLRRLIIDEHQLNYEQPGRLCYRESTGQLLVGLANSVSVSVFDVFRR